MSKRFLSPLRLVNLPSDPSEGSEGDIYWNTTDDVAKIYNGTSWTSIAGGGSPGDITEAAQDAVGNSVGTGLSYNDTTGSISVDTNTIQVRVADVSDTEIGYLNGVTSAIQTQIDGKISASSTNTITNKSISLTTNTLSGTIAEFNTALSDADFSTLNGTETLTNKTISSTNNTISITSSNVSDFTEAAQDAIGNSVGTGLTYNDITGQISVTVNTYDAYGSASTALNSAEDYTDAYVSTHNSDTTNVHGITDTSLLATKSYADSAVSTHDADTSSHGVTGNIVGTTDTQTLTNKTITSPVITGLTLNDSSIVFEGSTANDFETTLTVVDPTADRTITLPDVTGTVVTTGDTGTVTNTMLAGSIANNKLANSTISGVSLGSNLNALTIGTGLSGTSYNGSSTVTIEIDSTVATLTGSQTLTNKTLGSSTTLGADLSAATYKITNLGTPSASTDAATKQYVDDVAQGLHIHASCVTATTTNLTATYSNGTSGVGATLTNSGTQEALVIDGVTLSTNDRVLVKNQTTQLQNGIYTVTNTGSVSTNWILTRATDTDQSVEIDGGDFVFVTGGTTNDNTGWVQTETGVTVGTSSILYNQFSGAGTYQAGNGLTLTSNSFSINTTITADLSTAQTFTNKTIALGSNTVSGTIAQFNTALTDADFATLAGSETLTNKTLTTPILSTVGGDEGGQIEFGIAATNTTLNTRVAIDIYQDRLRIFETGGSTRGVYLNLADASNGVGSELVTNNATQTLTNKTINLANNTLSGTIPSGVLVNSTLYVGTTAIALNRASASQSLTGITSIDGSAAAIDGKTYTDLQGDMLIYALFF